MIATGTRIRFLRTLEDGPNEDRPGYVYARRGELGKVTGHGTPEGYWVKTDSWPNAFGASADEFEIVK